MTQAELHRYKAKAKRQRDNWKRRAQLAESVLRAHQSGFYRNAMGTWEAWRDAVLDILDEAAK